MRSPVELRESLVELAEPVQPLEGYEARVLTRARRMRARRRVGGAAAAAVCLAVVVTMFRLAGVGAAPQLVAAPPDGPFLGWSAAGDVDTALVRAAVDVWDRAGPHTSVRALVATREQLLHSVVVLQGYDQRHEARLAFFTSDAGAADALRLRADRPVPDPVTTQVISLVSSRLTGPAGATADAFWNTYAIVVAMPGVATMQVSSTTIDQELRGGPDRPTGRFVVADLPSATAETTTITGFVKAAKVFARWQKVFAVPGDGGADGDAQGVRGDVVRRNGEQVVVAVGDAREVRPGQFAVVAAGLVGRVTKIDFVRGEATVDLITGTGFTGQAYTAISDVPGSVRGTGGRLLMEHLPAGEKMGIYQGNRVLIPDPAQYSSQIGAVTIGRAAADKPADADTVELTPTADLADLHEVSIMTPYQKR